MYSTRSTAGSLAWAAPSSKPSRIASATGAGVPSNNHYLEPLRAKLCACRLSGYRFCCLKHLYQLTRYSRTAELLSAYLRDRKGGGCGDSAVLVEAIPVASVGSLVRDLVERVRLDVLPCACARPSRAAPRSITGEVLAICGSGGARARLGETTRRISVTVEQQSEDHVIPGRGRVIAMVTSDGGAPTPATPYRATDAAVAAAAVGAAPPRTVSVEIRKGPEDGCERVVSVSFSDMAQRGLKSVSFMAGTNFVPAARRGARYQCVQCATALLPCCASKGACDQPPVRYSRRRRPSGIFE